VPGKSIGIVPGVEVINNLPGIISGTDPPEITFGIRFSGSEYRKFIFTVRFKTLKGDSGPLGFDGYSRMIGCPLLIPDTMLRPRTAIIKPFEGTAVLSGFNMTYIRIFPLVHLI
jgi:hypothetical protein